MSISKNIFQPPEKHIKRRIPFTFPFLTLFQSNMSDDYVGLLSQELEIVSRLNENFYTLIPTDLYENPEKYDTNDDWYKSFTKIFTNSDYLALSSMGAVDVDGGAFTGFGEGDLTGTDDALETGFDELESSLDDLVSSLTDVESSLDSLDAEDSITESASSKGSSSKSSSSSASAEESDDADEESSSSESSDALGANLAIPIAGLFGAAVVALL